MLRSMVNVRCSHCCQAFQVRPYRLRRNKSGLMFCSAACRTADGRTTGRPPVTPDIECPICGILFHRKAAERLDVNYCSYRCAAIGTENLPLTPKGERRSPRTEFQPGTRPHNRAPVGTERLRRRPGRNDKRVWVKVAEPNVWRMRAVLTWENAHGPVPDGWVVHHRNRDSTDDRIENLETMSRASHLAEHRFEM